MVVNTTSDGTSAPAGTLTLRQALNLTNVPDPADSSASESITFDSSVFGSEQTITLLAGPLVLSNESAPETITAPAEGLTISGGGTSGVFQIQAGDTATFIGLSITGGAAGNGNSGGGVLNQGTVSLSNCTISSNSAEYGGGLDNDGMATLTDCTVTANTATAHGGGLDNGNSATLYLVACTISDNAAEAAGGGLNNYGTAKLTDSIVAGNTNSSGASDISGTVSGSYNLIGPGGSVGLASGGTGHNIILSSLAGLGLAPFGDYGGPTETMALLPGSDAIGLGTTASGVTGDQRGFPVSSPPDIGAFQIEHGLVVNTTADATSTLAGRLSLRQALDIANVSDPADPGAPSRSRSMPAFLRHRRRSRLRWARSSWPPTRADQRRLPARRRA